MARFRILTMIVWVVCCCRVSDVRLVAQQPNFGDWTELFGGQGAQNQVDRFLPSFMRPVGPGEQAVLDKVEIKFSEERQFGQSVVKQFEKKLKQQRVAMVRRGPDVVYLNHLVSLLKPLMGNAQRYRQIRVTILQAEAEDAFSIPGGDLMITEGLLQAVNSEATLVGVLGHELSHLDRGHQLYELRRAKLAKQAGSFISRMNHLAAALKPFHPEFEKQADEDAVRWMLALQYEPAELAHLLEYWDAKQDSQIPWLEFIPNLVRSHPDAGERALRVLEHRDKLAAGESLYVGRANLQQRIPRSEKRFAE